MSTNSSSAVRDVLIKSYVDPDSFIEFRDLCKEVGLAHSAAVRTLISEFICLHRKRRHARIEGPKLGQVIGVPGSFGSRVNYGGAPARLRP
ncbi:MAG: hypothetical protein K0R43_1725 [Pseudoduganella sp.]|jgi:hypothetical protein|nr:hypothetical protein [Pseudoduganella sp.]